MDNFFSLFPFELTKAQQRAIDDCLADLCRTVPMNRLLQGDVGSGKTMVAAACAYFAAQNGYQTAMMAPTEILAAQHYQTWSKLFAGTGITVGLLTGSMGAAAKRAVKEQLRNGQLSIAVGTHALLQESVSFSRLGLVITDEQHRFGVSQRMALTQKARYPHVLVMSATPIPRTLAFIIYGDLDLSILDEMPKGRRPVKTYLIDPPKRERAYGFIRKHLDAGEQAYIVCPLVEQGENSPEGLESAVEEAEHLAQKAFSGYAVGMLHGRMKAAEKEQIMADFQSGKLQLLVSTHRYRGGGRRTKCHSNANSKCGTVWPVPAAPAARTGGARCGRILLYSGLRSDRFPPFTGDLQNQRWIPGSRRRFEAARSRRLFRSSAAWAASHQNRRTSRGYGIGGQNPGQRPCKC